MDSCHTYGTTSPNRAQSTPQSSLRLVCSGHALSAIPEHPVLLTQGARPLVWKRNSRSISLA